MSFKIHYLSLTVAQRDELASRAATKRGTLNQIVYGAKRIEIGLADCLVACCPGLSLDDMPLTERAEKQRAIRSAVVTGRGKKPSPCVAERPADIFSKPFPRRKS